MIRSTPRARFADGFTASGAQPLSMDLASHLRIVVLVNGRPVSAILDSGASRCLLDERLVADLGLSTRPGFRAATVTGEVDRAYVDGVEITIGHLTLSGVTGAVFNLTEQGRAAGAPIELVLGRDVFEQALVDIDFLNGQIEFLSDAISPATQGRPGLPLTPDTLGGRVLPVSIEGRPPILALFDLGSNVPLLVSQTYADQHGLLRDRPTSTVASLGVEGMIIDQIAMITHLGVGDFTVAKVPTEFAPKWNFRASAVLGLPILARFNIITDHRLNRIWLTSTPEAIAAPLPKDRAGIGAERSAGGFRVVHVASGSPAMTAGLRAGNEIVTVDGQVIDEAYLRQHGRFGVRPAGTQFQLGLSDGRAVALTLNDYF